MQEIDKMKEMGLEITNLFTFNKLTASEGICVLGNLIVMMYMSFDGDEKGYLEDMKNLWDSLLENKQKIKEGFEKKYKEIHGDKNES